MFKVELIGNLGADAEVVTANGSKFISMRIAHTDKWTGEDGVSHEETSWHSVTMSNADSKVLPFLKQGTKIFVRGNARVRVYSSPKDRCMKGECVVSAHEVELVGGSSDQVPRELILPDSGQLFKVQKFYQVDPAIAPKKKGEVLVLVDRKMQQFNCIKDGWVFPATPTDGEANS